MGEEWGTVKTAGILSAGLGGNSLKGERKDILSGGSGRTKLEVRKMIGLFEKLRVDKRLGELRGQKC